MAVEIARALKESAIASYSSSSSKEPGFGSYNDAECISADSMQTYKGLDVITNKATEEEMAGVRHHLMDFLTPGMEYDVGGFVTDARKLVSSNEFGYRFLHF